jgi:hypothetical protein
VCCSTEDIVRTRLVTPFAPVTLQDGNTESKSSEKKPATTPAGKKADPGSSGKKELSKASGTVAADAKDWKIGSAKPEAQMPPTEVSV